ncbi:hypothetical protein J6590_014884 [Homalodisca vitripennis]|nr:hypothetical protein J6590_014884 [Homalodisca vitripennis]
MDTTSLENKSLASFRGKLSETLDANYTTDEISLPTRLRKQPQSKITAITALIITVVVQLPHASSRSRAGYTVSVRGQLPPAALESDTVSVRGQLPPAALESDSSN